MVDKSIHPFQTHFGLVFCHEAVQTSLLFPERGSIGILLLADSPIFPQHGAALTSGFGASQAETGGKGQVLPWDMVDKSISPYKPISGWFFRPEAVWTDHLTLE